MNLNYMPYTLVIGVVVVSFVAPLIIGFDDAWFVPLAVLPFAVIYLLYDRSLRRRGETSDSGH